MSSTHEQQATVVPLPHPARVAGDVVRIIVATHSEDDAAQRSGVARSVIDMWRRNGFRRTYGAGVGGMRRGEGWMVAPVCLRCAWVGELGTDQDAAGVAADAHRC